MQLFQCPKCKHALYFENVWCLNCQSKVGFSLVNFEFTIIEENNNAMVCSNRNLTGCNWVSNKENSFCSSCSLTDYLPNPSDVDNFEKLKLLEAAKRRLIYQLYRLKLPIFEKNQNHLKFDFLSEGNQFGAVTGHAEGRITILLSEADSVHREQIRKKMSEPYRTLLGHFRHEIGHYYWDILFDNNNLDEFRKLFGDESVDYSTSMDGYYKMGAPQNWQDHFISQYATSHPWEDWAETWSHYLHLIDTLETASSLGMSLNPNKEDPGFMTLKSCPNPYEVDDFKIIFNTSIALTNAVNSINRSMGISDVYPFIIPPSVYEKLEFIHLKLKKY